MERTRRVSLPGVSQVLTSPSYQILFRPWEGRLPAEVQGLDISDSGETIRAYKRTGHDNILDEMSLAGDGSPGSREEA